MDSRNINKDKDKIGEIFISGFLGIVIIILLFAAGFIGHDIGRQSTEKYYIKQLIDRNLAEYNPKTGKLEWKTLVKEKETK